MMNGSPVADNAPAFQIGMRHQRKLEEQAAKAQRSKPGFLKAKF